MSDSRRRLIRMMKDEETTTKSDYVAKELKRMVKTEFKPKPICQRRRSPPLKYLHTMNEWAVPSVPFDLYWKKENDIPASDPRRVQQPFTKLVDYDRERVQHARPRLVMTPAIPLDVIKEPTRKAIIEEIYKTVTERVFKQEIKAKEMRVTSPYPENYAPAMPITLPRSNPPYVSPEWRKETFTWEGKLLRGFVKPWSIHMTEKTPEFRLTQQPTPI